jgi:pSer/pThr/pTyr-binding forkhead associated (FHA) protein
VVIGRSPEADLVLDCDTVSRNHALVRVEGERLVIEDLSSRNGIWVAGQAIQRAALKAWEPIAIGSFVVRFHLDREARQAQGAEPTSEDWALEVDDERTVEEGDLPIDEPVSGNLFPLADLLEPEARSGPQGPGAGKPAKRVTTLVTRAPELRRTSGVHPIERPGSGVRPRDESSNGGAR